MKTVCFGEIMLRLSTPGGLRLGQATGFDAVFGGSEANVAAALAQWGRGASYVTRVPAQALGRAALGALSRLGVDISDSIWGGDRLGLYFLETGAGLRSSVVLYDRQHSGMATLAPGMIDWNRAFLQAHGFHWSGITPALSAGAAAATQEALDCALSLGLRISCDLNYREKLWQYGRSPLDQMPPLVEYADLLLGDPASFEHCLGIRAENSEDLLVRVRERFPRLQHVAMTLRDGWSAGNNSYRAMLFDGDQMYYSATWQLPDILDRIGSGDALMAGLIFGLHQPGASVQDALEYAAAAGAMKHYIAGDSLLCTESELRDWMSGRNGAQVRR